MFRSGSAAGLDGLVCFIAYGKEVNKYFTPQKLVEKYGLSEGLSIFMNDIVATLMMRLGQRLLQLLLWGYKK